MPSITEEMVAHVERYKKEISEPMDYLWTHGAREPAELRLGLRVRLLGADPSIVDETLTKAMSSMSLKGGMEGYLFYRKVSQRVIDRELASYKGPLSEKDKDLLRHWEEPGTPTTSEVLDAYNELRKKSWDLWNVIEQYAKTLVKNLENREAWDALEAFANEQGWDRVFPQHMCLPLIEDRTSTASLLDRMRQIFVEGPWGMGHRCFREVC